MTQCARGEATNATVDTMSLTWTGRLYAEAIERGELVRLLPDWRLPPGHPDAVVQAHRYSPAKINAALRLFQARIGSLPGILPAPFTTEAQE